MVLATLVAISGPKKVPISRPTPSNAPRYGLLPHPNPYVPPHINNRYITLIVIKLSVHRQKGTDLILKTFKKIIHLVTPQFI
jgi:hypothetical protein